jgi:nitroimidazol reductase NimA-like FMN-containing flavoprotein (pyridoxamine 5'-phosphate oxidase superfamily)
MENFQPTANTTLKRLPARGAFERDTVNAILDAAFICHVGFVVNGQPFVIPTSYARIGDELFIHGSAASRMLRNLSEGIPVCVTVTHVDGLVLARSAFHHSINYRSVMVFGTAQLVTDEQAKFDALRAFTEHIIPGRWPEIREPNAQELKATTVLALPLREASAKIRTGPPKDDDEDMAIPVWAGVLPLTVTPGEPMADPYLPDAMALPEHVKRYGQRA